MRRRIRPTATSPFAALLTLGLAPVTDLPAQQTHVVPLGAATSPGSTSNNFPWGTGGTTSAGIRVLACYDSSHFLDAAIDHPITISRLRWRADDLARSWDGGSYSQATVRLSTAAIDYTAVSTDWNSNHGGDLTTCYTGTVTMLPDTGNGPGLPGPFHVDVQLATPFTFDPTAGDLVIDCDWNGAWTGGTRVPLDIAGGASARASRVFSSSQYPNANGTTQDHGVIVELTYSPATPDIATATPYGAGCYDTSASFYEIFPPSTFDLSNTGITLTPDSGGGYAVLPTAMTWFTPTSTPLSVAGNGVRAVQLPFSMPYPGGATNALFVSSNGFVWATPNVDSGCCTPNQGDLLNRTARWAPLWCDLDPAAAGTIHFDVDPSGSVAYVTYRNVPERNQPTSTNSFQIAFFASGAVEYRYGNCAVTAHTTLTGWSPGNGARDSGASDLSTDLPLTTTPDSDALALTANSRPVTDSTAQLVTTNVPLASTLGAMVLGFGQFLPGLDLGAIGMRGCLRLVTPEAVVPFVPQNGTGSYGFAVPNDSGLTGLHVFGQAAAIAPGANLLGVIGSNGIDLRIGTR
ncbi:MAG: hypothetical protein NXI31_12425 [bacterium]|nr:hypothetical protein [bacterium]